MHEILVNRLGGLSLPRKSVVRLTDRPDITLDVYRGRKTTIQYKLSPMIDSDSVSLVSGLYVFLQVKRLMVLVIFKGYVSTECCIKY